MEYLVYSRENRFGAAAVHLGMEKLLNRLI
jgi:hypothetical protein